MDDVTLFTSSTLTVKYLIYVVLSAHWTITMYIVFTRFWFVLKSLYFSDQTTHRFFVPYEPCLVIDNIERQKCVTNIIFYLIAYITKQINKLTNFKYETLYYLCLFRLRKKCQAKYFIKFASNIIWPYNIKYTYTDYWNQHAERCLLSGENFILDHVSRN